jgi:hypothetical protein
MRTRIAFAAGVVAAAVMGAGPARADQVVTFNVPVSLSHLYSDVKSLSVQCRVNETAGPGGLAFNRTDLPVTNGTFHGTVQVKVAIPDSMVSQAKVWTCLLYLFPAGCIPAFNSNVNACKAKEGTQLVTEVSGPLTAQGAAGLRVTPQLRGLH